MTRGYRTDVASSSWHGRVPIGERLSAQPLLDDPLVSLEGELTMAPLEPMLVPEEPRAGDLDPSECGHCRSDGGWIWSDDSWHVASPPSFAIPFWAGSRPIATCDSTR